MARLRSAVICATVAGTIFLAPVVHSAPHAKVSSVVDLVVLPAVDTTLPDGTSSDQVTDTTFVWRLENDPSQCINSNPRPNCGYKPQDAGERGGALQITLFFVLMGALGVIGTVIGRNIVRRDRAIAEQLRNDASSGDTH